MDKGYAVEFDTPQALAEKQGHFRELIDALGETEANLLTAKIK